MVWQKESIDTYWRQHELLNSKVNYQIDFWGDCIESATYIINRIPLSVLRDKSPYELLYNKIPSLAHLRVIGCLAFATNLRKDDKFAAKAGKAALLGYVVSQKG